MKRLLILISFTVLALTSSAQKYQDALLYGENKNRADIYYLLGIPNDTFAIPSYPQDKRRHPHVAAKDNTIYLWDTTAYRWNAYAPGGGIGGGISTLGNTGILWLNRVNDSTYKADSAAIAGYLLRRKDSASASNPLGYVTKTILKDSVGKKADTSQLVKIDTTGATNRWVLYWDSPTGTFKLKPDSTGAGSTYTFNVPLSESAGTVSLDTASGKWRSENYYKTIFPQLAGSYANPAWITSLALNKITGLQDSLDKYRARYDSAHYTVILLNDSTAIFRSFNGQDDTLQFHGGVGADSVIYATIHRTDTLAQNIRDEIAALPLPTIQHAFDLEPGGSVLTKSDSIMLGGFKLNLLNGQIKTTGHSVSMKSTDSVLVRDANGDWKSLSQWNLNGGQARTGIYLNSTKTWTKQVPYVFGTTLVFSGNSFSNEGYTTGTPWPTQVTNYFGKTKVIRGRDADDLTGMIMRDYNTYNGRQSDSIAFCDVAYVQLMGVSIGGTPSGANYYADALNVTKTMNYIRGSWRAFIANYYLDTDTFSVNSLGDANFRAAVASDSLGTKTAVGAIGLGSFSFTKPAGKTSVVIGTYGADGTRTNQGTIVVTNNGTEIFRKNYDSLNVANRGRDYKIKVGLNFEAIVLQGLPSAASTIEVTALNDSTRFDYIGYLVPKDSAQKPLYINNLGYGYGSPGLSTQRQYIDSANAEIQNAVADFSNYPVFINNYNRVLDSTVDINASRHLSSTGNDVVADALLKNLVKIGYKPINPAGAASSSSTTIYTGNGSFNADRDIDAAGFDFRINDANEIGLSSDSIIITPVSGVMRISNLVTGGTTTDSILVRNAAGQVKAMSPSRLPGIAYKIGTYNSQTINGDGASIVGDSIYMQEFSAESPGLVPAGGSGTTYLRGDGTWQTVSGGGSPAGNFNNVQVNRNGSFAALASDSLSVSGSTLSSKLELSLIGATPTVNFGTAAGNPEIVATASALIIRRNDVGAYIDVTLGALAANSFSTTGNGSIAGKLSITTGTNKSAGTGTLASGTATISTTQVTANSLIFIQYTSCSNCGSTYISAKTASTSFVVTSTNGADASTFNWWIIN